MTNKSLYPLPAHEILYITHNENRSFYQHLRDYIQSYPDIFDNLEMNDRCIKEDEIWEIRWYPMTPIRFFIVYATTLDEVIKLMHEAAQKDRDV